MDAAERRGADERRRRKPIRSARERENPPFLVCVSTHGVAANVCRSKKLSRRPSRFFFVLLRELLLTEKKIGPCLYLSAGCGARPSIVAANHIRPYGWSATTSSIGPFRSVASRIFRVGPPPPPSAVQPTATRDGCRGSVLFAMGLRSDDRRREFIPRSPVVVLLQEATTTTKDRSGFFVTQSHRDSIHQRGEDGSGPGFSERKEGVRCGGTPPLGIRSVSVSHASRFFHGKVLVAPGCCIPMNWYPTLKQRIVRYRIRHAAEKKAPHPRV